MLSTFVLIITFCGAPTAAAQFTVGTSTPNWGEVTKLVSLSEENHIPVIYLEAADEQSCT